MNPINPSTNAPGSSNKPNYSLSAQLRPQDVADIQTRVADNGDIPAKSTYRKLLEEKLSLRPFADEMRKMLAEPIKVPGERKDKRVFSTRHVFRNEKQKRRTMTSLYNTEHLETRKRLREILMDDDETDEEDGPVVTQLDVDIALEIHRMRRKIQKKYHKKMDNRKFMFYGAGLVSEYDPYPQHREVVKKIIEDSAGDVDLEKLGMESYWRTKLGGGTSGVVAPIDGEAGPPTSSAPFDPFEDFVDDVRDEDDFEDSDEMEEEEDEEEEDSLADVVDKVAKGALGGEMGTLSKRGRKKKEKRSIRKKKSKAQKRNLPSSSATASRGNYEDYESE